MDATVDAAVQAFGETLGVEALHLQPLGVAEIRFDDDTTLSFEWAQDALCILYTVPPHMLQGNDRLAMLAIADYRHGWPIPVSVTLTQGEGRPMLFTYLAQDQVRVETIALAHQTLQRAATRL